MNFPNKLEPYTLIKLIDAVLQFLFNIAILRLFSSNIVSDTILIVNCVGLIYQVADYSQSNLILSKEINAEIKDFIFEKRRLFLLLVITSIYFSKTYIGLNNFLFLFLLYIVVNTTHRTFTYYFTSNLYKYNNLYTFMYIIISIISIIMIFYGLLFNTSTILYSFLVLNIFFLLSPFLIIKVYTFTKSKFIEFQSIIIQKSSVVWFNQITYSLKLFLVAYYVDKYFSQFSKEYKLILISGTIISTLAYSFLHQFYLRYAEQLYFRKSLLNLSKIIIPVILIVSIIALFTNTKLNILLLTTAVLYSFNTGIYLILITFYTLNLSRLSIIKFTSFNIVGVLFTPLYYLFYNTNSLHLFLFLIIFASLEIIYLGLWIKNQYYLSLAPDRNQLN